MPSRPPLALRAPAPASGEGGPSRAATLGCFCQGENLPGETVVGGPCCGGFGAVEQVAVRAPLLVGVGAAGWVVVGQEKHERCWLWLTVAEVDLDGLAGVRGDGEGVAVGGEGGED